MRGPRTVMNGRGRRIFGATLALLAVALVGGCAATPRTASQQPTSASSEPTSVPAEDAARVEGVVLVEFGSKVTSVTATRATQDFMYGEYHLRGSDLLFTVAVPRKMGDPDAALQQAFPSSIGVTVGEYLAIAVAYERGSGETAMSGAVRLGEMDSHPLPVGWGSYPSNDCFLVSPDRQCRLNMATSTDRIYVVYVDPRTHKASLLGRYVRSAPRVDETGLIERIVRDEFSGGVRDLMVTRVPDAVEYASFHDETEGFTATTEYPYYTWGYRIAFRVPGSDVRVLRTTTQSDLLLSVSVFPSTLGITEQEFASVLAAFGAGTGLTTVGEVEKPSDAQLSLDGHRLVSSEGCYLLFPTERDLMVETENGVVAYVVRLDAAAGTATYVGQTRL